MQRKRLLLLSPILLFILTGCFATPVKELLSIRPSLAGDQPPSATASDADCIAPDLGQHQLIDASKGICFVYPDTYDVFQGEDGSLTLYILSLLNTEAPLATVHFEPVGGRTLDGITAQILSDFALPDSAAQTFTLGGKPAVVLDNLPGQDTNRRVLAIHGEALVDLTVARIGADYGVVGDQAENLFNLITGTMLFIETKPGVPLLAWPECPAVVENTTLYSDTSQGYCFLLPDAYTTSPGLETATGGMESVFYVYSLQDVSHARMFITVEDALDRSLEEVTITKEAEIEAAVPGFDLVGSFGYMLDCVPANQFERVPGQDLSRQVLFIHDGRLFTLAFIPDDSAAGSAYNEMEVLYEIVMNTFSFMSTRVPGKYKGITTSQSAWVSIR